MSYSETETYPRGWNKIKFPIVAHIEILAEQWTQFNLDAADQTQIQVLGHDLAGGDWLVAHVGCSSEQVKQRLEKWWA